MSFDLIVAGVGGQGSILLSHIIADAAIRGDKATRVRVGETFGAAMRGGSVASHVRIGPDACSYKHLTLPPSGPMGSFVGGWRF